MSCLRQDSNPRNILHSRQMLYQLSHRGSSAGWVQSHIQSNTTQGKASLKLKIRWTQTYYVQHVVNAYLPGRSLSVFQAGLETILWSIVALKELRGTYNVSNWVHVHMYLYVHICACDVHAHFFGSYWETSSREDLLPLYPLPSN